MDRRTFIAVGATALLAGCDSQNTDDTETPDETPGGATGTPAGGDDAPGDSNSPTPHGECDVDVVYDSCASFTVTAESYGTVFVSLANGSVEQFEGEHSGEETFETSGPISYVLVACDEGSFEHYNPDATACSEQAEE